MKRGLPARARSEPPLDRTLLTPASRPVGDRVAGCARVAPDGGETNAVSTSPPSAKPRPSALPSPRSAVPQLATVEQREVRTESTRRPSRTDRESPGCSHPARGRSRPRSRKGVHLTRGTEIHSFLSPSSSNKLAG